MKSFCHTPLRSTIVAATICQIALPAYASIDLTPAVSEYTAEGMKFEQLVFHDNKQRIEYELPTGWTFDGSATEFHLKPPQKNFAEAVIQALPLSKPQALDENTRNDLKQKVIGELPAGSQFVRVEQEIVNPILLSGRATFEVTVSYQLLGEKFCRSVLFANREATQWLFRFTAKKTDFEPLQGEFRRSILSWHWLKAE